MNQIPWRFVRSDQGVKCFLLYPLTSVPPSVYICFEFSFTPSPLNGPVCVYEPVASWHADVVCITRCFSRERNGIFIVPREKGAERQLYILRRSVTAQRKEKVEVCQHYDSTSYH